MSEVHVKENESLDSALRRWKKSCARSGVLAEVRKREHYEKPSVKRKKKSEAARKRKYKSAWKKRADTLLAFCFGKEAYDMSLFYPTIYRRRITDLSVELMHRLGVQGILLDVDNTLTPHDDPTVDASILAWLDTMRQAGFLLTVVSNNSDERVRPFAEKLGLGYQAKAAKPLPHGYRAAARAMGFSPRHCLVVGDQIFTDILGANLAGMPSVLLEPIEPEVKQKFIVFKRRIERLLMRNARQRRRREGDYENA